MKFLHCIIFLITSLLLLPSDIEGQTNFQDLENIEISILTCRSGDELYSTFGHTAIRIVNSKQRLDATYNYGVFSFNAPNFYLKFMRGKLPYYLAVSKTSNFLAQYNYEKRTVIEQVLNLNNEQKVEIIQFLIENSKPENKEYKYDFFYDNCATRVVDVYSLIGDISYSNEVELKTFRDLLKENLKNLVWSDFGIDLVIGARADREADRRGQMFLPEYVMNNLESAIFEDTIKLADPPYIVLDFEDLNSKRKKSGTNWPLICTSLLLILTVVVNYLGLKMSKFYNRTYLIICGIVGLLLLFMWFGTEHGATKDNWNILWLNPLFLAYLVMKKRLKKWTMYILVFALIVSTINCLFTILPQFFNLAFLPLILALAVIFYKEFEKDKKVISIP